MTKPVHAAFALKADIPDPQAATFTFAGHKTMYGGKDIAAGDKAFLFASEKAGGQGLFARVVVTSIAPVPRQPNMERQTVRVTVVVARDAAAKRRLGRRELQRHGNWQDGRPETELNFKLYRQATNKIVGLTPATAAFLDDFF